MAYTCLSCETLKATLIANPDSVTVIDIRDQGSFDAGHIGSARHVDNSSVDAFLLQADKLKPLIVCCYRGISSQGAADYFNEQGFQSTYSLDGGYEQWKLLP